MNEQKRLEYRQPIDQLFETINKAVQDLHRLLLDRLFISEKLKKAGVIDDFLTIKQVINYDPELQSVTARELQFTHNNLMERENKLREKILETATADIVKLNFFGMPIDE